MKKSGLFPVNNVIISLLWFVLSSAGGFVGAQEEPPQIKASYPVMQAVLKMPESTVYVRSLDEALRDSENIVLCRLYSVRIEKPHNTEGQVTCFLEVLSPLRGKRFAVGSKGVFYSYWEDMLFIPEVKEDPQKNYDRVFPCNIKCFLMCGDEEAGVSESGEFRIFRERPLIHLIYGKEVEEYIMNFLHTEIESDVINDIVCKLQTKQLSHKETRVELEKFIAELFHVLSLDRNDERTHAEVWDHSYHIEFLNDDMMIVCNSEDASYMRISPTGKVRFQPFIIPFDSNFLRILWPI